MFHLTITGGQLVPTDRRIERVGTNLHILVTDVSDNGKYQCVAGGVTASIILNVISKYTLWRKRGPGLTVSGYGLWV